MDDKIRILLGLDKTATDAFLLRYLQMFNSYFDTEKIYFFHILPLLQIPEKIKEKYFKDKVPEDENIKDSFKELRDNYFSKKEADKIEIEVRDGFPDKDMLKWSNVKKIDLLILGKKPKGTSSGRIVKKMINIADASLLLVPHVEIKKPETIYVAMDYSKVSKTAFKTAAQLAEKTGAKIICHHVYQVPSGYHHSGKSYDEFAQIMKQNAEEESEKLLENIDQGNKDISFEYTLDTEDNPAKIIHQHTKKIKPDLIFIGSKGRTAAASLFLGSVAEKCLDYTEDIPVFIAKRKGENLDFIDTLLKV